MNKQHTYCLSQMMLFTSFLLSSCSAVEDLSNQCDVIANPDGPAFFRVENNLSTGLSWSFQNSYAFGASMKPGECTLMGVSASQYTIQFQQCTINDAACAGSIGPLKTVVFSVAQGNTHTIAVENGLFN